MTVLNYLIPVIPMLGILIFVHELGHFAVAKWCGVRVLKFSLGFGSPIGFGRYRMRWERNGTEYVIAWFPLGGFVKMLGENLDQVQGAEPEPEEVIDARPDEYLNAKPTWQKLAITFAGPVMNLLLPVVAFVGVLAVGLPRQSAVVGMIEPESPAAQVALQPGDRIASVDGERVAWWDEVERAVRAKTQGEVALEIERGGETLQLKVPVKPRSSLDGFGDVTSVGWIGADSARLPALVGIPDGSMPAAQTELRSGDLILKVAGQEVEDWEQWEAAFLASGPGPLALEVIRDTGAEKPTPISIKVDRRGLGLDAFGVVPAAVLVQNVSEGKPAERAGLKPGDLVLSVDGQPVGSFSSFADTVRTSEGRPLKIAYARGGETYTVSIAPETDALPNAFAPEGMEEQVYMIGVSHRVQTLPGVVALDRERNPLVALPRGIEMTWDTTLMFLKGLGKIFSGDIGTDKLAGPIGIAEIARKSLDLGWYAYLSTMILISINLGILNLLPIPILDGGQAVIYMIEGVRRAPISLRAREMVQSFGLTLLLMLMGLAFWNDVSRNWSRFVAWLSGGEL